MDKILKIMVIDPIQEDLETMLGLLAPLPELQVLGYFQSPYSALSSMLQAAPDLLIVTAELPGVKSPELTANLLKHFPAVRIILASSSRRNAVHAFFAGAKGFIPKPYRLEGVRQAIYPFLPNNK